MSDEMNLETIKEILNGHTQLLHAAITKNEEQIKKLDKTITSHNGRLRKMEEFALLLKGGRMAISGVWGVVGVFFIATVFAVFQMYTGFRNLDTTIALAIAKELEGYEFIIEE